MLSRNFVTKSVRANLLPLRLAEPAAERASEGALQSVVVDEAQDFGDL